MTDMTDLYRALYIYPKDYKTIVYPKDLKTIGLRIYPKTYIRYKKNKNSIP